MVFKTEYWLAYPKNVSKAIYAAKFRIGDELARQLVKCGRIEAHHKPTSCTAVSLQYHW